MARMRWGLAAAVCAAFSAVAAVPAGAANRVEVIAELGPPPLARAVASSRVLKPTARLDLAAPLCRGYRAELAQAQARVAQRIRAAIPGAEVRWRYTVTLDGLAVVLPARDVARLRRIPGVVRVDGNSRFVAQDTANVTAVKAPLIWGPDLATAGQGVKIGIIDDGIDQSHPYFGAQGFVAPAGYPLGQKAYTTGKVIVARSFWPPSLKTAAAREPFETGLSAHGTHVAGIAAGDYATRTPGGVSLSGIAPRAFLGNYKVYSRPDLGDGLNGNAPEVVAGIEAAVADGMDVINLSLGEVEIDPRRDVVARALDAAADAGVVPVAAAGNDFADFGHGSIISPSSAAKAISVAAADVSQGRPAISWFSSAGPTPVSLRLKPDVTAPGSDIVSSLPNKEFGSLDGTSMASPHVAGAAALLLQRHPDWTVEQVKSALTTTGSPVYATAKSTVEVPVTREGGGLIDISVADQPLLFTAPTNLSFGLVRPGQAPARTLVLSDAGGGAGTWSVTVDAQTSPPGTTVTVPATATIPGRLVVTVHAGASEGDAQGFVVLTQNGVRRRVPYWAHVETPVLAKLPVTPLTRPGTYTGNDSGRVSRISSYRYPDDPTGFGIPIQLNGPEQVFRIKLGRAASNMGVAIVARAPGSTITARLLYAGDENRLTGVAGLPLDINPYSKRYDTPAPVVGAIAPPAGTYDVVFDSRSLDTGGRFTFRFWVDDFKPPAVRLLTPKLAAGALLRIGATDAGSGVDPASLAVTVDGRRVTAAFAKTSGIVVVATTGLAAGRHRLHVSVADYQETKNDENRGGPSLPNTATLSGAFTIR